MVLAERRGPASLQGPVGERRLLLRIGSAAGVGSGSARSDDTGYGARHNDGARHRARSARGSPGGASGSSTRRTSSPGSPGSPSSPGRTSSAPGPSSPGSPGHTRRPGSAFNNLCRNDSWRACQDQNKRYSDQLFHRISFADHGWGLNPTVNDK